MYSWNNVSEKRRRDNKRHSNKKVWKTIIIGFGASILIASSAYMLYTPRIVHGSAALSNDYRQLRLLSAQQVALTYTGALHFSGNISPVGTNDYTFDVMSLGTGEVYGTLYQGDMKAQILGIEGRTYLFAEPDIWKGLSGYGEFGDGYALATVLSRHWTLIPTSLLGFDIGRDFLPTQFAQLMGTTTADMKLTLSENVATSSATQLIKVSFQGKVRENYQRVVKADLQIDYPKEAAIRDMLKEYRMHISHINARDYGTTVANWRTSLPTTEPMFRNCFPTRRCYVSYAYTIPPGSLNLPQKSLAVIDAVLTARHDSDIVGVCQIFMSRIEIGRETKKSCLIYLRADNSVPLGKEGTPTRLPLWDDEIQVSVSSVLLQGIPTIFDVKKRVNTDIAQVRRYTTAQEDFHWSTNTVTPTTGDDSIYSRYVTGLEPSIHYIINGQELLGYSARTFIVPIGPSYTDMISKSHNIVTYSANWARTSRAQGLLVLARQQIRAVPNSYRIVWYCPSIDQTIALRKFLGANHLVSGIVDVGGYRKFIRLIDVATLSPIKSLV